MNFKKIASKSIALSLVGVSIATPILNTSYAMEPSKDQQEISLNNGDIKVNILEDSEEQKVVEVTEGDKVSVSVFNKKDNTLSLETKTGTQVLQNSFVDMDETQNTEVIQGEERAVDSLRCIYSKLKYSINMKSWTITNSKGSVKKRPETASHKDYLYRFKDSVKASRRAENSAEASMGAAKIATIIGVVGAASGVGAVIAAVTAIGGSLGAAYSLWDSVVERREADRYFAIL